MPVLEFVDDELVTVQDGLMPYNTEPSATLKK